MNAKGNPSPRQVPPRSGGSAPKRLAAARCDGFLSHFSSLRNLRLKGFLTDCSTPPRLFLANSRGAFFLQTMQTKTAGSAGGFLIGESRSQTAGITAPFYTAVIGRQQKPAVRSGNMKKKHSAKRTHRNKTQKKRGESNRDTIMNHCFLPGSRREEV